MRALVIYDTSYGNTAVIAKAICSGLGDGAMAREVETLDVSDRAKFDLYVVGSPTQAGRATPSIRAWLQQVPREVVEDARFAAFDTRLPTNGKLGLLMRLIGHAAPRIARELRSRGAIEVAPHQGFTVIAKAGPLAQGEVQRATAWGAMLAHAGATVRHGTNAWIG